MLFKFQLNLFGKTSFSKKNRINYLPVFSLSYFNDLTIISIMATRKKLTDVKYKYSPQKKSSNKFNQVFVKEYKFGLLSLILTKGSNVNIDAYFKDFADVLDSNPQVAESLGIVKVTYVRDSSKCNLPKIQTSGYKSQQLIGIVPQEKENNSDFRRAWAEKIISYLNSEVSWKYENIFKFKADITRTFNDQINSSLDECLLDEDIGGFVGTYLYEDMDDIKNNIQIMKDIFGHEENLEIGKMILLQNWNNWNNDE